MSLRKPLLRPGWVLHLLPALLSVLAIFYFGTSPGSGRPAFSQADKVSHFIAFAFVQFTHARALGFLYTKWSVAQRQWRGAGGAALWGALLELCQSFLPYRSAEFADLIADGAGAGCAAWIATRVASEAIREEG